MPFSAANRHRNRSCRSNALPEGLDYEDTGCSLQPACLTCPYPLCRYDDPRALPRQRARAHRAATLALYRKGANVDAITRILHIGRRTVFRYLAS